MISDFVKAYAEHRIDCFVCCSIRRGHTYVLIFDSFTKAAALRQLGAWASNPDLSFTWYDAALVSIRIRTAPDFRGVKR